MQNKDIGIPKVLLTYWYISLSGEKFPYWKQKMVLDFPISTKLEGYYVASHQYWRTPQVENKNLPKYFPQNIINAKLTVFQLKLRESL